MPETKPPCGACQAWGQPPTLDRGRCTTCDRTRAQILEAHDGPMPAPPAPPVFAFACNARWEPIDRYTVINARSRSKARYLYLLDVRDCWPDVTFADLRVRKLGPPHTSEAFKRNALYRGIPDAHCGQRVRVNSGGEVAYGAIVGHNGSANLDILFDDDGPFKGATLNVHPAEVTLLESAHG